MTTERQGISWLKPTVTMVILVGCAISMLTYGPRSALGLFLQPMTEARGWSREVFALSIAIQNIMWGIGQPIAGAIADRYGTARVLAGGGVIYAAGLYIMAHAEAPLWLHVSAGVLIGLGIAASSFSIVITAFARTVSPGKRTVAFGIGTAAGSLGQFVFAPLGQGLIEGFGWTQALVILGAMMFLVPLLAPVLAGRSHAPAANEAQQSFREALSEAFGHRSYVLLVLGFFVCGFHVAFITTHLPPYIADVGIDPKWGAWAIAVIGLFNVIGSLMSGVFSASWSKPYLLSFIYFARAIVITIFVMTPPSAASILVFGAAMGLLWLSTVPPTTGLITVMFGVRYMGTLYGFVFLSHQVGAFIGVWLGGLLYDATGSYDAVWWVSVALGVAAAIIHWPISERPVARLENAG
ncbi:MAG TPA: MFS transporter [Kaistiaceae bacterium]|nr:MFS transporter [Kaistiaceae bacterium]